MQEMKKREKRAQEFMNKMADNVLQKMEEKQKQEDDMLRRYENEREMRQRQLEERRLQRKSELSNTLFSKGLNIILQTEIYCK